MRGTNNELVLCYCYCGNSFLKRRPLQIYCSPKCRKQIEKDRKKQSNDYRNRQKKYHSEFIKKEVVNMTDKYIKLLLTYAGYDSPDREIIELKRSQLILKRTINEKANAINNV